MFWDLNELHMSLECFPHLFGEIKLEDFMHASALDFLNHDGVSDSILLYDGQKDIAEVISDRNYAVGEQVMVRYGKYSNAMLALNFGFTLPRNIYDQQLEIVDDAASRSMHPFRKKMAKDIIAGELQVLQSAHAWVGNYCKTVNMS
ncbi:hypothetical protein BRADI_2g62611v3 [Brachypodium distachyon]|uniref:SET domain-containing protein n=1 Tax=Brachypodium distachyon TaxID=15368 RepID=A0A0Q3GL01_BRADI|nr:hypothetical protein BRADI_2g62611v3 [Brachypodium distachyon]